MFGYACDDNPCMDYTYTYYPPGFGGEPAAAYYATCDSLGECVGGVPLPSGTTCNLGCQTGTCDGSGTCSITGNLPEYSYCTGRQAGSTLTNAGSCTAGECIF
jgi:hypothetical protein